MKRQKALYFFIGKSSFVEKDIAIYSEFYTVKTYNFSLGEKWKIPFQLIDQFFFLLTNLFSYKVCIIQLGGIHSLLPVLISKIAKRKSVIIAGGTDCHSFPSIDYGNYQRTLLAIATRWSFRLCSHIIPKHKTLWRTKYTYDTNDYPEQGIAYFNKNIRTPFTIVENGYDADKFNYSGERKKNSFITVSGLLDKSSQQKLKGIDLITEVAALLPEHTFTIVGGERHFFQNLAENIYLIPATLNSELPAILGQHEYYLQLSMAEGFPNALCEAMLCGCIPVGSDVFSIPEIIGNTGYLLMHRNVSELKELIENLPQSDPQKNGRSARERIKENYTLEKRKLKFEEFFRQL